MIDEPTLPEDRALFDALARLPKPHPPAAMARAFRARVRAEPPVDHARRLQLIVAIAALLLLAILAAWQVDRAREGRKVDNLRAELVTALTMRPDPTRFQAITVIGNSRVSDDRITAALTTALLTDANVNVRVAAAEALGRIATPSALRSAAERSMRSDASPFVQAALLAATTRLPQKDRAAVLRALLARPDLDSVVRAEAEQRQRT